MRTLLSAAVSIVLVAPGCTAKSDDVTIAVVGPVSGAYAAEGREARRGAQLAAAQMNTRGGVDGRQVKIVFRDSSDVSRINAIVRDVVRMEPAAVVIAGDAGPLRSASNAVTRAGIPTFATSSLADRSRAPLHALSPSTSEQAGAAVEWVTAVRGIKRLAIVSGDDLWGKQGAAALRAAASRSGAEIAGAATVDPDAVDLTGAARSVIESGAEAAMLWLPPAAAAKLTVALRAAGSRIQLVGSDKLLDPSFRSLAGTSSDNVALVLPAISETSWLGPELRDFIAEYHRRFTMLPIAGQRTLVTQVPMEAVTAYDAVQLVLGAVADGSDREEISRSIADTKDHDGVLRHYDLAGGKTELSVSRFFNLALVSDVAPGFDADQQIAFYKVQVSAYHLPEAYLESEEGQRLSERVLEDVLSNPETVGFFTAYSPPRPPPGPL